jgi:CheY-like chemotaxis protein/two-component sensor histidine kinase
MFDMDVFLYKLSNEDNVKRAALKQRILLNNISHSIKTPLNGILHMTNLLSSQPNEEYLQHLNHSVATLANNIFDIIDMAQLENGDILITKDLFTIHTLVSSVMAIIGGMRQPNSKISIKYHIEQTVPEYIYSDQRRIKQILINLLENAVQHTIAGSISLYVSAELADISNENMVHSITTQSTHYNIVFTISDTGTGITPEIQENLFKPVEIVESKQTNQLGLRVSSLLAHQLNGDVRLIQNKYISPNTGCIFELSIIVSEGPVPIYDSNSLRLLKGRRTLVITLVEKIALCQVLESYGVIYIISDTYQEAIILHGNKQFDLIILQTDLVSISELENIKNTFKCPIVGIISDEFESVSSLFIDILTIPIDVMLYRRKLLEIFNTHHDHDAYNILIAGENYVDKLILDKLLRTLLYKNIYLANNYRDIAKIVSKKTFDVIILDLPLSICTEVVNKIVDTTSDTSQNLAVPKIIAVTTSPNPPQIQYITNFIDKPINIAELEQKIRN